MSLSLRRHHHDFDVQLRRVVDGFYKYAVEVRGL